MQSSGHTMAFGMVELRLDAMDKINSMLIPLSHVRLIDLSWYWNMPWQEHPPDKNCLAGIGCMRGTCSGAGQSIQVLAVTYLDAQSQSNEC